MGLADSTRRKTDGSIQDAKAILLQTEPRFPKDWQFPFNLACYSSQLGELEGAKMWLKRAMAIDAKTVKPKAIDDEDLKPLWDSMSETLWTRE